MKSVRCVLLAARSSALIDPSIPAQLAPIFKPPAGQKGSVTAANASPIRRACRPCCKSRLTIPRRTCSDGAAALVLMSGAKASALGAKPLARIVAYADAERKPEGARAGHARPFV